MNIFTYHVKTISHRLLFLLSAIFTLLVVVIQPVVVSGLSPDQIRVIDSNIGYYDPALGCEDQEIVDGGQAAAPAQAGTNKYIAAGSIPATGLEVGATTYGGSFRNNAWTPSNDMQGGTRPYDDNGMGNDGKPNPGRTTWAELGVNGGIGNALGKLPAGTKLEIKYNGKTIVAERNDIGSGGGPINGKPRAVDLWWETARLLNFTVGSGVVTIHAVDPATPVTPVSGQATLAATTDPSAGGGKIYVVGDSLTVGMRDHGKLGDKLKVKGWDPVKINAIGGKPLSFGVEQLNADKALVATASSLLVNLGTNNVGDVIANNGSSTVNNAGVNKVKGTMQAIVDAAKAANPNIKIYWTDFYGKGFMSTRYGRFNLDAAYAALNGALGEVATKNNITVLKWSSSDVAKQFVPINDVHPNGKYPQMADFIVDALRGTGAAAPIAAPTIPSDCVCAVPSSATVSGPLVGKDNKAKVWNFLISKKLTVIQAAGAMGNIEHESAHTWNPRTVEFGWGFPKEMDTVPPNKGPAGQPGYGLVQWTSPGRKDGLRNFSAKDPQGRKVNDLSLQLDFMWSELEGPYKSRALDPLRQAKDLATAVRIWQDKYEVGKNFAPRMSDAQKILAEFGSTAGAVPISGTSTPDMSQSSVNNCPPPGASNASAPANGNATIVGDNAFPLAPNKRVVTNRGMFSNGTASKGGHPYTAYDIMTPGGTTVVAFLSGEVTHIGSDRCPGRLISIYNAQNNIVISYLHLDFNNHVKMGDVLKVGDRVGAIGPPRNGCGVAHLHIDAARGRRRPGCSRLNCSAANKSQYVDIGPQLYKTFQAMPN